MQSLQWTVFTTGTGIFTRNFFLAKSVSSSFSGNGGNIRSHSGWLMGLAPTFTNGLLQRRAF